MDTTKFTDLQKEFKKNNPEEYLKVENYHKQKIKEIKSQNYIYVKDAEGYVSKINEKDFSPEYTRITEQEWADASGETYYKKTYGHGGARIGAGRKPLYRNINIRVTIGEKDLLDYIRTNAIDPIEALRHLLA